MFEGKSYGLVMSSLRKAMDHVRAMKAVFVFANYGLIDHKHETGDGYDAFRALCPLKRKTLRRALDRRCAVADEHGRCSLVQ